MFTATLVNELSCSITVTKFYATIYLTICLCNFFFAHLQMFKKVIQAVFRVTTFIKTFES